MSYQYDTVKIIEALNRGDTSYINTVRRSLCPSELARLTSDIRTELKRKREENKQYDEPGYFTRRFYNLFYNLPLDQ